MPLTFGSLAGFTRDGGRGVCALRRTVVMALTAAIVTRAALFRAATGPPDLDHFRYCGDFGRGCLGNARIHRCISRGNGLRHWFSGGLLLRRFNGRSFDGLGYGSFDHFHRGRFNSFHHSHRFRLRRLDGNRLSRFGRGRESNIGQQRC